MELLVFPVELLEKDVPIVQMPFLAMLAIAVMKE